MERMSPGVINAWRLSNRHITNKNKQADKAVILAAILFLNKVSQESVDNAQRKFSTKLSRENVQMAAEEETAFENQGEDS